MTASRKVQTVFSPLFFFLNEEAFRSWGEMVKNLNCGKFMNLPSMTCIMENFLCDYDRCCSGHRALQKSQGNTLICRNLVTWLLFKISRKSIPLTIIQTLLCTFQIHTCSLHYFTTVLLIFLNSFTGHPVFLSALLPHSLFFGSDRNFLFHFGSINHIRRVYSPPAIWSALLNLLLLDGCYLR